MVNVVVKSTYYQFLIFLRIKQAVFFTLAFPIFLFIVFGSIWGKDQFGYIPFLLSGIIGMTIASDGLFSIGPVIKEYYSNGLIKYLRKLPFNILFHFMGLIISRVITQLFVVLLLCLVSRLMFGYSVTYTEIINFIFGVFVGLFVFSFLGLVITFSGIKKGADKGIMNFLYFVILFTSNTFYPVKNFNEIIGIIGNILPLNPILAILRGGGFSPYLMLWLTIPTAIFYLIFNKIEFER